MKVIGKTKEGLIVTITEKELSKLMGFASTYSSGWSRDNGNIGAVHDVSQIFADADTALTVHKNAMNSAKNLKGAATKFLNFFTFEESTKEDK